jgi:hypothetical protein
MLNALEAVLEHRARRLEAAPQSAWVQSAFPQVQLEPLTVSPECFSCEGNPIHSESHHGCEAVLPQIFLFNAGSNCLVQCNCLESGRNTEARCQLQQRDTSSSAFQFAVQFC